MSTKICEKTKKKHGFPGVSLFFYTTICKKIPGSIFSKINYNFFKDLAKNEIVNVFSIRKHKKVVSIITVVEFENYNILKKKIFRFLELNQPIVRLKLH